MVELWNQKVLDYGYANISEIYANQKAILNEMLVVESNDKMVGVIDLEGNDILEPKYDKIKYLANIGEGTDFLVSSNKKVGIMSNNRKVKIPINYDSIELLDIDSKLYIVKNDNKYGVMDFNGSKIIYIENETIGIDVSKFSQNELKNKYILADNLIPAKKNSKWALYNKKGEIVSDGYIYDNIGYTSDSSKKDIYNLVVIPEYNIVIAKKGNYYVMITQGGEELLQGVPLDDVYMVINGDTKQYLISANNITYNAVDLLEKIGIKKSRNEVNEQSTTENAIIDDSEQNANKNNTTNEQKNNEATNTTNVKQENNTEIQNNENINTTNETNETNEQNNVANETNQQNEQQDNQQNSNTESTGADVIFY